VSKGKPRITIVGLGLIGGSIGLALRQAGLASAVVGHDRKPDANRQAKKVGAVDRTDWNLISACENADLVILAIPAGEIEPTLQAVGPYLRPGCVVMDTAAIKEPVLAWAAEALPEGIHFVGGNPIITKATGGEGLEVARADLFQKGVFCVVPSPGADPMAVKLATDLVAFLGAKPLFVDPVEHDGMLAGIEHLPALLAMTLLEMASQQPVWQELRKVAGSSFEIGTRLASMEPASLAALLLQNRDNVLRWLDLFSESLASIRKALAENDNAIAGRFEVALEERWKWLHDREVGQWEELPGGEMPERPNLLADMFLGGLWDKWSRKKDK
jgi:prephenate dehydrogenase